MFNINREIKAFKAIKRCKCEGIFGLASDAASDAAVTSYLFYSMFTIYWCVTMAAAVWPEGVYCRVISRTCAVVFRFPLLRHRGAT